MANAVAAGARGRTKQGASKPTSMKPSTTAGKASVCWRPSRRKFSRTPPSRSSRATTAPTSRSTGRSTPTAAASMAASTAIARPSHGYLGHSAGLDFETKLFAKSNAAALLGTELAKPGYKPRDDRARRQYRPLSADRARATHHAIDPRSAGANEPSGRHHHQVGADRARHRHPAADGGEEASRRSRSRSPPSIAALRAPWSRAPRRRPRRLETVRR